MTSRVLSVVGSGESNGAAKRQSRTRRQPALGPRRGQLKALRQVETWAGRYVGAAVLLSAGLNAFANVDLCPISGVVEQGAAGCIGAVVPGLVWLCGKVAGWSHRAARRWLAVLVGLAGVCLLLLSVAHCAHAIAHLTGSGWLLAALLAVGIDYGLVASEVAAIVAHQDE
jgi:hypothetical protein